MELDPLIFARNSLERTSDLSYNAFSIIYYHYNPH